MPRIVIHGPQASGKSHNAADFLRHYRCTRLVDNWDGRTRLRQGDLALTNLPPPYLTSADHIVDVHTAKAQIGKPMRGALVLPSEPQP